MTDPASATGKVDKIAQVRELLCLVRVAPLWGLINAEHVALQLVPPNLRRSLDHVHASRVPTRSLQDRLRQPTFVLRVPAHLEFF